MLTIDRRRAGIGPGTRPLDLGCGAGRHTYDALRAGAEVVAGDSAREEVASTAAMVGAMATAGEITGAGFGPVVLDALALPYDEGTFDVIVVSEVFEHVPNDAAAFAEVARALRRGGVLALSVPRWGPERINWWLSRAYHETPGGHVRIYRRRGIEQLARSAGLEPFDHHYRHGLHAPYWWLRCIVGVDRDDHRLVAGYHRFLVWDLTERPRLTRALDAVLNPLIGKSFVLYCRKAG